MSFENKKFDMVIDKSTIDALLCGDLSFTNVCAMMNEIQRVLTVGGIYLCVTYGTAESRRLHF